MRELGGIVDQNLLISIKTQNANQIFNGSKKFEFRRRSIGDKNCNKKIFVYSSEKDKSIIGYIIVDKILKGDLKYLLEVTNYANNKDIINYFEGCNQCFALHISEVHRFLEPINIDDIKNNYKDFVIPQFYRYIKKDESIFNELEGRKTIWKHIIWS